MLTPKANLLAAIRYMSLDHVPYWGDGGYALVDYAGRRPPRSGRDEWGVMWEPLPDSYQVAADEPAESYPAEHPADAAAELLAQPFPPPPAPARFAGLLTGLDSQQTLVIGQHPLGLFDRFATLLGTINAMTALLSEEDACLEVFRRLGDYHAGVARGYLAAGAEAGWFADDYAGGGGPLIRPALWRKLILPEVARVFAVYRAAGAPVFFHTCGHAKAFLTDLLDAGAQVLNLEGSACDVPGVKRRFGQRAALIGGVTGQVMLHGSPAQVREAVQAAVTSLSAGGGPASGGPAGGGLILAPEQRLAFPAENVAAFIEAARSYESDRQASSSD